MKIDYDDSYININKYKLVMYMKFNLLFNYRIQK